jgi:predicted Zn-dependent protease
MKCILAMVLSACAGLCSAQAGYPEPEAAAAWRGLAASYVRKAVRDGTLVRDAVLNARVDRVMAVVGAAARGLDRRFAGSAWNALLIEDFGHGAAAFPGGIILMDANFVRALQVDDDQLALILAHECAHVLAGHASAKLAFMAEFLGKERIPTARTALLEFLATDAYAAAFQSRARVQEREADALGAAIFLAAGYDATRALALFDKLAALEGDANRRTPDAHEAAALRKQAVAGVIADLRRRGAPPAATDRVTAVP